jgi:hypothetical protein
VELDSSGPFDVFVAMKFGAVVCRYRLEQTRPLAQKRDHTLVDRRGGAIRQLPYQEQASCPIDDRHHAVLAARAHDGIDLAMSGLGTALGGDWAFGSVAFAEQVPAPVRRAVALPPLDPLAQAPVKVSSGGLVP